MDKFRRKLQILQHKKQGAPLPPTKKEYIPPVQQQLSISLCCTCKGRKEQLGYTVPSNLEIIKDDQDIEYILLDYDSPDNLKEFAQRYPQLKYYRINDRPYFHHSEAKNFAHAQASNAIVINIDSETYFTKKFIDKVRTEFTKNINIILHCDRHGVIALSRENFQKLNGYDTRFIGWGSEDNDLVNRARNLGLRHKKLRGKEYTSYHDHKDKVRNRFTIIPKHLSYPANKEILKQNERNKITRVENKPIFRNNNPMRFVIVVGLPRSGTSCVAGTIEKLGIAFSPSMYGPKQNNQKGFYECVVLANVCHRCVAQPSLEYRVSIESRKKNLLELYKYYRFGIDNNRTVGMKHPLLTMMLPEAEYIFGNIIWVNVIRPLDKIKQSAISVGYFGSKSETIAMLDNMNAERNHQMDKREHLDVYYERLLRRPEEEIERIANYLGTNMNMRALEFVDDKLRHF